MRKDKGYFTVEAAMVFPVAFAVVLFVIYLLFFQYNRCLLEQDVGVIALRGASIPADNNEERMNRTRQEANALDNGKYVAWNGEDMDLTLERGKLCVSGAGEMEVPFALEGVETRFWIVKTEFENHVLNPVSFIRNCRKVLGGNK